MSFIFTKGGMMRPIGTFFYFILTRTRYFKKETEKWNSCVCSTGRNENSVTIKSCVVAAGTLKHRTILCTSNPTSEMKTGPHINTHEQIKKTSSPKVGWNSAKIQRNTVKHATTWMDSVKGIK